MLEHLDTLIAFAAVMLGLSLLVTVLTQMVTTSFGLRRSNLEWGLQRLLEFTSQLPANEVKKATEKILSYPPVKTAWRAVPVIRQQEFIDLLRKAADDLNIPLLKNAFQHGNALATDIERWFDRTMDRATDRFVFHTRIATVILSLFVAFAFRVDAPALLKQLSDDAQLRASLVQQTDSLLQRGEGLLAEGGALRTSPYNEAIEQLREKYESVKKLPNAPSFVAASAGESWLRQQLQDAGDREKVVMDYHSSVQKLLRERLGHLGQAVADIHSDLGKGGLQLRLLPYPDPPMTPREFGGILISAMLLSLGAPLGNNCWKSGSTKKPAQRTEPPMHGTNVSGRSTKPTSLS